MYPLVARRSLDRQLDALSGNLPDAVAGDVEALHRARVASRRLREILAVLAPGKGDTGRRAWRKAQTAVRGITRALGGVRELDVALGLLDEIVSSHPSLTAAVMASRAVVDDARRSSASEMEEAVKGIDLPKLAGQIEALVNVRGDGRAALGSLGLGERIRENASRLDEKVAHAGTLFAMDRLHKVRIAAKKLRYLLELVEQFSRIGTRRAVNRLRGMQDLLGRMHDLGVLADHVRRAIAPNPGAADVKNLLDAIEQEIHGLHAQYLARVGTLAHVVDECRGRLMTRMGERARNSRDETAQSG